MQGGSAPTPRRPDRRRSLRSAPRERGPTRQARTRSHSAGRRAGRGRARSEALWWPRTTRVWRAHATPEAYRKPVSPSRARGLAPGCMKWTAQAGWRRPLDSCEGPAPGLPPRDESGSCPAAPGVLPPWRASERAGDGDRAGAESERAKGAGPPSAEDMAVSATPRTRGRGKGRAPLVPATVSRLACRP